MRCRSTFGGLALAIAMAGPASAQILDSRPDVIAFYADPVGNRAGVCAPLFTPQSVYLMITHPSDASGMTAYGCSFALPPGLVSLGFSVGGGIIIQDTFPVLDVGFATPRPAVGEAYTLGTWLLMMTSPAQDIVTLIDHFPDPAAEAAYRTAGSSAWIPVTPPDWGNGMPFGDPWWHSVLWLNDPFWCGYVTPADGTNWGTLKAGFR